jgi:hypothetical protein
VSGEVVAGISAAARLNDPRLARIFDADYRTECPFVVSEWAPGTPLEDLVIGGLPSPAMSAAIMSSAAGALAVAHDAGRPHLCLNPRSLRYGRTGVKVTGTGIEAVLSHVRVDE